MKYNKNKNLSQKCNKFNLPLLLIMITDTKTALKFFLQIIENETKLQK